MMVLRTAAARLGIRPAPIFVSYEVTHLCNLECGYCDRHTQLPREMTREQIFKALDELCALGLEQLSLDGGEPLTHRDIDDIVTRLRERGIRVLMNTNGILVPKKLDTVRKLAGVKISLDGPEQQHDQMRGRGAHAKAVRGAQAARDAGIGVELTCVVGRHNAGSMSELLEWAGRAGFAIIFQPARNSLFLESRRDGDAFILDRAAHHVAFAAIEAHKRAGRPGVGNAWASLRHFRKFPADAALPCNAGWITATLDPEGYLYHCGQVSREGLRVNVTELGVEQAFARLERRGCSQCWCARVVESNLAWGGRLDQMLAPGPQPPPSRPQPAGPILRRRNCR